MKILWMMDDRVSRLLKFLGAEEKRGFLWNLMGPTFFQFHYDNCAKVTILEYPCFCIPRRLA